MVGTLGSVELSPGPLERHAGYSGKGDWRVQEKGEAKQKQTVVTLTTFLAHAG